jgi:hypothetical protein
MKIPTCLTPRPLVGIPPEATKHQQVRLHPKLELSSLMLGWLRKQDSEIFKGQNNTIPLKRGQSILS